MSVNSPLDLPINIALVHEWFTSRSTGGAENVVKIIDELLTEKASQPQIFSLVNEESLLKSNWLFDRKVKTSFIQKLPFGISHVQQYLPLLPFAIEQINLEGYKLVISSSHLVAKGVLTSPDQLHISYVHTPVRYAWDQMNIYLKRSFLRKIGLGPLIRLQLHTLRQWDQLSSSRIDYLLANSNFTAKRIWKYWRRRSEVIHPPVNVDRFEWNKPREDFYLSVCRLVPNKRVDLLVRAFNRLKLPLVVVGEGVEKSYLKDLAGPTVKILGFQSKEKIESLMSQCRAFVYAGIEDFGIAPVEAMASGAPVIALGKGGVLDTVKCLNFNQDKDATGLLFYEQTVKSLVEAIEFFNEKKLWREFNSGLIRDWANSFSQDSFKFKLEKTINRVWSEHKNSCDIATSDLRS
ncbi:glycosyltransferase [Prochlorococcus marinus]|uniref:Glycosyl transferase family 1 n=1 Tax=Prochlorococcus marinus XMU1408 TaxID=2213228 RepID=A0A318R7B2_PROMR|nr:glycosyltransferase [Prochlorococcus marinus]MBW3042497.1 glycosyl transferase family 1 [Prochlorococcus marinus str. XMU1408]PYE01228.1 glycosyl transferase family 1 [Prochlorococcus marinus XMU1408]